MTASTDPRPIADDELLITRVFSAPASLVFKIWDDSTHMIRWWGPKDFVCTDLDFELQPGRPWRARIVNDQHGSSWMSGVIRQVERPKRIVFTFMWEDNNSQVGVETLVTVDFAESEGRTTQTFHQTPFVSVSDRDSHVGGWTECFDREQAYAETLSPGARP